MSKKKPCAKSTQDSPRTDCTTAPKQITPAEALLYGLALIVAAALTGWLLMRGYTAREALALVVALLVIAVIPVRLDASAFRRALARMLGLSAASPA
jgi:hypothetical protein